MAFRDSIITLLEYVKFQGTSKECILNHNAPCEFFHKADWKYNESFAIYGKMIRRNGHAAQFYCVFDVGQTVSVSVREKYEQNHQRFLIAKAGVSPEYPAMALFDLSRNIVCEPKWNFNATAHMTKSGNVDELLENCKRYILNQEERRNYSNGQSVFKCNQRAQQL